MGCVELKREEAGGSVEREWENRSTDAGVRLASKAPGQVLENGGCEAEADRVDGCVEEPRLETREMREVKRGPGAKR